MSWWSKALLGVATTGMLAAGATAFAAGQPGTASGGFWNQVAADLHVSPTALENAIRTVELQRFQQYAQSHHLTAQQIAARTNAIEHGPIRVVIGGSGRPWMLRALNVVVNTTATTVNLTPAQVRQELGQGKTLTDIANAQHVDPGVLQQNLVTALENQVQTLENAGKLSASRASALDQQIPKMVAQWMTRKIPLGRHRRPWAGGPWLQPAAQYLGISVAQLRQDLAHGQSPATVAQNAGKSVDGLIQALQNAVATRLGQAVQAGRISSAQEQQMVSRMDQAITAWVNRTPGAPPPP
jgi:AraC-like DNA-binding protein